MRYLTHSELIFINGKILKDEGILTGKTKVRDLDLLLAAEQRPQASAFGQDAYPTLREKVAALLHSLTRNHPFRDGNKRTAVVALLMMLRVNGWRAVWNPPDALQTVLDVAEGRIDLSDLVTWLHLEPSLTSLEPDAERDAALIDELLIEHKWLLDELAER